MDLYVGNAGIYLLHTFRKRHGPLTGTKKYNKKPSMPEKIHAINMHDVLKGPCRLSDRGPLFNWIHHEHTKFSM